LDEAERARAIWRVPRDSGTQKSAWYMRSSGEIAQLRPGADYSTTVIETEYEIKTQPDRDTITMVSNTSHHSWINQAPERLGYLLTDCLWLQEAARW
jgi:predicted amino acid racemase